MCLTPPHRPLLQQQQWRPRIHTCSLRDGTDLTLQLILPQQRPILSHQLRHSHMQPRKWSVPDLASQRHLTPNPTALGTAAEDECHNGAPALQGQLAL